MRGYLAWPLGTPVRDSLEQPLDTPVKVIWIKVTYLERLWGIIFITLIAVGILTVGGTTPWREDSGLYKV